MAEQQTRAGSEGWRHLTSSLRLISPALCTFLYMALATRSRRKQRRAFPHTTPPPQAHSAPLSCGSPTWPLSCPRGLPRPGHGALAAPLPLPTCPTLPFSHLHGCEHWDGTTYSLLHHRITVLPPPHLPFLYWRASTPARTPHTYISATFLPHRAFPTTTSQFAPTCTPFLPHLPAPLNIIAHISHKTLPFPAFCLFLQVLPALVHCAHCTGGHWPGTFGAPPWGRPHACPWTSPGSILTWRPHTWLAGGWQWQGPYSGATLDYGATTHRYAGRGIPTASTLTSCPPHNSTQPPHRIRGYPGLLPMVVSRGDRGHQYRFLTRTALTRAVLVCARLLTYLRATRAFPAYRIPVPFTTLVPVSVCALYSTPYTATWRKATCAPASAHAYRRSYRLHCMVRSMLTSPRLRTPLYQLHTTLPTTAQSHHIPPATHYGNHSMRRHGRSYRGFSLYALCLNIKRRRLAYGAYRLDGFSSLPRLADDVRWLTPRGHVLPPTWITHDAQRLPTPPAIR